MKKIIYSLILLAACLTNAKTNNCHLEVKYTSSQGKDNLRENAIDKILNNEKHKSDFHKNIDGIMVDTVLHEDACEQLGIKLCEKVGEEFSEAQSSVSFKGEKQYTFKCEPNKLAEEIFVSDKIQKHDDNICKNIYEFNKGVQVQKVQSGDHCYNQAKSFLSAHSKNKNSRSYQDYLKEAKKQVDQKDCYNFISELVKITTKGEVRGADKIPDSKKDRSLDRIYYTYQKCMDVKSK